MPDEINDIKINMAKFETKLESFGDKLNNHITDQKKDLAELKKIISNFIDSADERYAPMWTADAVKWTIVVVMGAVLVAALGLVIIK